MKPKKKRKKPTDEVLRLDWLNNNLARLDARGADAAANIGNWYIQGKPVTSKQWRYVHYLYNKYGPEGRSRSCRDNNKESRHTYVYLISNGKDIKIGHSVNPHKRVKEIQTSSPTRVSLLREIEFDCRSKAKTAEKHLHHQCRRFRLKGEWFKPGALRIVNKAFPL